MYSTLVEKRATTFCFLELHCTRLDLKNIAKQLVDLLSLMRLTQSAFVKASLDKTMAGIMSKPYDCAPLMYLRTLYKLVIAAQKGPSETG